VCRRRRPLKVKAIAIETWRTLLKTRPRGPPAIPKVKSCLHSFLFTNISVDESAAKRPRPTPSEQRNAPTRQYLDQTVVPILLEALAALAKERPPDPIDYLVDYLQKHRHEHSQAE